MRKVTCPQCGKPSDYSPENPHRPFCCERCQLIDLGEWADGKYKIPTQDQADTNPQSDDDTDNQDE